MVQDPDPIRAKKRARWNALRQANRDIPADSVTAMVEKEFAQQQPIRSIQRQPAVSTQTAATEPQLTADQSLRVQRSDAGIIPTALHGATFGASDEALGAIRAGLGTVGPGPETTYAAARDEERAKLAQFRQEHPIGAGAIELGGGLLTGGALLRGANTILRGGLATGGTALQTAKAGAVGGGVYGFNDTEGDLGDRLIGAGKSAAVGGGTGFVLGGAAQKLFGPANNKVNDVLIRAAARDQQTPTSLVAARQSMPPLTGDPETIMELSGTGMRRLARGVETMPGRGSSTLQNFARQRGEQAPAEAIADLEKVMGRSSEDTYQLVDNLVQARKADSRPLYESAYKAAPIEVSEKLEKVLASPTGQAAMKRAQAILADEQGAGLLPSGGVSLVPSEGRTLDVRAIDYLKKGLDDVIKGRMGAEGGLGPNQLRSATALKHALLDEVDGQMLARGDVDQRGVPLYKAARNLFGDESEVIESIELGRQSIGKHPGQIRQLRRSLSSAAAREGFEIGWMQGATDNLAQATPQGQLGAKMARSPYHRDAVSAALGDDATRVDQIQEMLARRAGVTESNRMFSGSRTTPTAEDVADLTGGTRAGLAVQRVGNQGVFGAMRSRMMQGVNRRLAGLDEEKAGEVADQLIKQGPSLDEMLRGMVDYTNGRTRAVRPLRLPAALLGSRITPEDQ